MRILCRKKIAESSRKDAIVLPVYKNIPSLARITGKPIDDELSKVLEADYFNFEEQEIASFYVPISQKLKKVYLLSVPKEPDDSAAYRELGAALARVALKDKIDSFSLIAFEDIYGEKEDFSLTTAFLEGVLFALYTFDSFKSKPVSSSLEEAEVITENTRLKRYLDECAEELIDTFKYVNIARDLVNTPANALTPALFADFASARSAESVKVTILNEREIEQKGLALVAAVGRGSANPPRFVHLYYNGAPHTSKNIALVGKGVTFDSGGSNLKSSDGITGMKSDMGGAAAAFSALNLAASRRLPVNIHCYIPLVENIIGGDALRTGDIIKSYAGKTVEVLNTDAEGRLILADALYLATATSPELIIDIATLTGACEIALGECCAGLFSNRKFLSKNLYDVAQRTGEDVWELPLYDGYAKNLKSEVADLRNLVPGPRYGGAIMAALFLKEFTENYPWIHLDIAGPAFLDAPHPVAGLGASGYGVRLLYHFIKTHYLTVQG